MTPEVSVVIPTCGRLAFLSEAVASVTTQSFNDLEVIVVDDDSQDGTAEWLATNEDPRVRHVRIEPREERSAARNRGLELARGRYVLFLDDDDVLIAGGLGALVDGLRREERAVAAVGACVYFDDAGNRRRHPHPRRADCADVWRAVLFHWVPHLGGTLFRADVVREIGGFRPGLSFGEDWEVDLRLTKLGPVALIPRVVSGYRQHAGQILPANVDSLIDGVAAGYISELPEPDEAIAKQVDTARRLNREGRHSLDAEEARKAIGPLARAIRTEPSLLSSSVIRHELIRPLAKAIAAVAVTRRGERSVRRFRAFSRRVLRRTVHRPVLGSGESPSE